MTNADLGPPANRHPDREATVADPILITVALGLVPAVIILAADLDL